jgi:myosin-5
MLVPSADWFTMIQNIDLQKLCSLILEKTINDADKYQNGLTKIFFRAGMLAALESLRSERLNALVVIIQKNMRRRMAQKKYRAMRQAAIRIQTWWRVIMARAFVEGVRKTTAAIKLQTAIRRFIQRRSFKTISTSVARLQSRKYHITKFPHTMYLIPLRHPRSTGPTAFPSKSSQLLSSAPPEPFPWFVSVELLMYSSST